MTNEKDAKIIHNLFAEYHYADDLGVIKSKLSAYVATVRREEREAALTKIEEAVWVATRDFRGILNELQRRAIALAVVEHLKTNENRDERKVENDTRLA